MRQRIKLVMIRRIIQDRGRAPIAIGMFGLSRGQSQTPVEVLPAFEVASVKLTPPASLGYTALSPYGTGRFTATKVTLDLLVQLAFAVSRDNISTIEKLDSEHCDVTAKPEGELSHL